MILQILLDVKIVIIQYSQDADFIFTKMLILYHDQIASIHVGFHPHCFWMRTSSNTAKKIVICSMHVVIVEFERIGSNHCS